MKTVLLGIALLAVIAAMSATGGGVRDQIDPELTTEVEALLAQSPLRDFAGLAPIAAEPPAEAVPYIGVPLVEIPLVVESGQVVSSGFLPLTDLDALYGVDGPPPVVQVQSAPALDAPPADLVDDTPAIAWVSPPLDAK